MLHALEVPILPTDLPANEDRERSYGSRRRQNRTITESPTRGKSSVDAAVHQGRATLPDRESNNLQGDAVSTYQVERDASFSAGGSSIDIDISQSLLRVCGMSTSDATDPGTSQIFRDVSKVGLRSQATAPVDPFTSSEEQLPTATKSTQHMRYRPELTLTTYARQNGRFSRHIPSSLQHSIGQDDLDTLRRKGVFELPSKDVCDGLIRCYFRYVHPYVPMIEVSHFLDRYEQDGLQGINLILLWSMLFAASNVCSYRMATVLIDCRLSDAIVCRA